MPVPQGADELAVEERFWRLYEQSLPHVHGYLARRCDPDTAQDLTQEVYLDLVRRARQGDDLTGLGMGWLLSVARSRLIDHLRARQRQQQKLSLAWSAADQDERRGRASADATPAALGAATERALRTLSADERGALVLHHLDGISVGEVAGLLGRTVRATESLLARARRKFRAAFAEDAS
jgi:RNA polymerase sigma-70 factor (ECF subfamily)